MAARRALAVAEVTAPALKAARGSKSDCVLARAEKQCRATRTWYWALASNPHVEKRFIVFIAWTTVARREDAETIAAEVVRLGLAVCVQIDGPIVSHYQWQGRPERTEEFRLCLKCLEDRLAALEADVFARHPYETPEWIVVRAEHVGEKYLSWAKATCSNPPL